jgi:hypothetical protein
MSRSMADAIRKQLEVKKQELRDAYTSANKDPGQVEATNEWEGTAHKNLNKSIQL